MGNVSADQIRIENPMLRIGFEDQSSCIIDFSGPCIPLEQVAKIEHQYKTTIPKCKETTDNTRLQCHIKYKLNEFYKMISTSGTIFAFSLMELKINYEWRYEQ